jgi:chromosome segregation ATPase
VELADGHQLLTQSRAETEEQRTRNEVLEQEVKERVAELSIKEVEVADGLALREQLQAELTKVQVELADGHQLLTQSRAETEEQRTRNEVLEQEVKERVAELASLQAEGQALREQLQAELTKVQVELADGHQLLTQSRAETEEQRTRNEVLEQEVKERVAELASLQAESLKVREQLQTEIQAMNEQMRHVQEELEHYFFAHQQADDKNKDLVDQFQSLTQQLANCRQELDKSNLRIDDLEDQLQQRAVELASTQAEGQVVRELLQAELTNVQEQLAERNKLLTQSRTTSEEQHGRIGVLEQELQRRVVELASLQAEGHVVREQLQAESQAMNEQLRHVQEELEHYFLAHQKAEESNKNLDIRYQDATQHLSDCRQELEKSKLRIDELEDKLQQRDFELASIQSEGQKVRELLQAELSKVQEELVEQSQLLAQSRAVTQDQHGRIETLEYELKQRAVEQSSTLVQSQAMSEQLRNVQEELEHYFIKHKQAQERSNDLDNQVQSTTRQLVSSQQQLVESHSRIAVLESQVKHVQEELDHYFMFSREQSDLIDKQKQQQQRAVQMLIRCLSGNKSAIGEDLSVYHNLLKGIDQSFEVHDSKLLSVDDVQTK